MRKVILVISGVSISFLHDNQSVVSAGTCKNKRFELFLFAVEQFSWYKWC